METSFNNHEGGALVRLPRFMFAAAVGLILLHSQGAVAQIGGKTAADGPFVLDNVEDLNLNAGGVSRNWIPDYVAGNNTPLQAISLTAAGLSLASGQSPQGSLKFSVPTSNGYVNKSFGVPMPAVAGGSTLASPGNISSFTHLTFLACFSTALPEQTFQMVLETYPGPNYPKLYYKYTPAAGNTFQRVTIDLRAPSLVENAGSLTLDQLLSQTRYLAFYFYGGPSTIPKTFVFHVDDIGLINAATPPPPAAATSIKRQQSVRIKAVGGGYQELFYNYSTSMMSVSPYSAVDAAIAYQLPTNQWTGIYHYDYATARFSQAVYQVKHPL